MSQQTHNLVKVVWSAQPAESDSVGHSVHYRVTYNTETTKRLRGKMRQTQTDFLLKNKKK